MKTINKYRSHSNRLGKDIIEQGRDLTGLYLNNQIISKKFPVKSYKNIRAIDKIHNNINAVISLVCENNC